MNFTIKRKSLKPASQPVPDCSIVTIRISRSDLVTAREMSLSRFLGVGVTLFLLFQFSYGVTWYDPEADVSQCTPSDSCHCQFSGRWDVLDSYFELKKFSSELTTIGKWLKDMDLYGLVEKTINLSQELDEFEGRIQNISVDAALQQYSVLEKKVSDLAEYIHKALLDMDLENEIMEYQSRTNNVSLALEVIWNENPFAVQDDLNEKVSELTGKLNGCQRMEGGSYFRGDNLPYDIKEDWCDQYEPVNFGDSLSHGESAYTSGNWFKDPYPVDDINKTMIWTRDYSSYSNNWPFRYGKNYSDFIDRAAKKVWPAAPLTTKVYGLGYTIYNGSIFYHYGAELFKYTISNGATHRVPFTTSSTAYLRQDAYTRVDMKADEYGLYAIYTDATNDEKLIITQINPLTLERIRTWNTNKHKATVCATFMICGKLYSVDNCWSRLATDAHHKQYSHDTLTDTGTYGNWYLTAKFGHVRMVGYNPRERLLFGWDNGHMVTYPITWRHKVTTEAGQ